MPVTVDEAKPHFPKLLERVALGEEVVIARAGHPVAKLVAYDALWIVPVRRTDSKNDARSERLPNATSTTSCVPSGSEPHHR